MFSYLSFTTCLSWLDENDYCYHYYTDWNLRPKKTLFMTLVPGSLGCSQSDNTAKQRKPGLETKSLNNLHSSNYSSRELFGVILKRTSLDGPIHSQPSRQKNFQISTEHEGL